MHSIQIRLTMMSHLLLSRLRRQCLKLLSFVFIFLVSLANNAVANPLGLIVKSSQRLSFLFTTPQSNLSFVLDSEVIPYVLGSTARSAVITLPSAVSTGKHTLRILRGSSEDRIDLLVNSNAVDDRNRFIRTISSGKDLKVPALFFSGVKESDLELYVDNVKSTSYILTGSGLNITAPLGDSIQEPRYQLRAKVGTGITVTIASWSTKVVPSASKLEASNVDFELGRDEALTIASSKFRMQGATVTISVNGKMVPSSESVRGRIRFFLPGDTPYGIIPVDVEVTVPSRRKSSNNGVVTYRKSINLRVIDPLTEQLHVSLGTFRAGRLLPLTLRTVRDLSSMRFKLTVKGSQSTFQQVIQPEATEPGVAWLRLPQTLPTGKGSVTVSRTENGFSFSRTLSLEALDKDQQRVVASQGVDGKVYAAIRLANGTFLRLQSKESITNPTPLIDQLLRLERQTSDYESDIHGRVKLINGNGSRLLLKPAFGGATADLYVGELLSTSFNASQLPVEMSDLPTDLRAESSALSDDEEVNWGKRELRYVEATITACRDQRPVPDAKVMVNYANLNQLDLWFWGAHTNRALPLGSQDGDGNVSAAPEGKYILPIGEFIDPDQEDKARTKQYLCKFGGTVFDLYCSLQGYAKRGYAYEIAETLAEEHGERSPWLTKGDRLLKALKPNDWWKGDIDNLLKDHPNLDVRKKLGRFGAFKKKIFKDAIKIALSTATEDPQLLEASFGPVTFLCEMNKRVDFGEACNTISDILFSKPNSVGLGVEVSSANGITFDHPKRSAAQLWSRSGVQYSLGGGTEDRTIAKFPLHLGNDLPMCENGNDPNPPGPPPNPVPDVNAETTIIMAWRDAFYNPQMSVKAAEGIISTLIPEVQEGTLPVPNSTIEERGADGEGPWREIRFISKYYTRYMITLYNGTTAFPKDDTRMFTEVFFKVFRGKQLLLEETINVRTNGTFYRDSTFSFQLPE
jgi:hypothetical protein